MTQHYGQPQWPYGHAPMDPYAASVQPRRACRAAAVLQFVVGALMLACGVCCAGAGMFMSAGGLPAEQIAQLEAQVAESGLSISPEAIMITLGALATLPAVPLIVLGFFVWRGSRAAIITSLVFAALGALALAGLALDTLLAGILRKTAEGIPSACVLGLMLLADCAWGWLLIRALRETKAPPPAAIWPGQQPLPQPPVFPTAQQQPPAPYSPESPPPPPAI